MDSYLHGLNFVLSLVAIYFLISPFIIKPEVRHGNSQDSVLVVDKLKIYAEELRELEATRSMNMISEEEYLEQKNLLLGDANKVN